MAQKRTFPMIPAIAIILFLVIMAGFIPALFAQSGGEQTSTLSLNTGETETIKPPIETRLTNVTMRTINNESHRAINVCVIDQNTGNVAHTGLMNLTETSIVQLSNEDISVNWIIHSGSDAAVVSYSYPSTYGMGGIQFSLVRSMGVLLLIIFIYIISRIINVGGEE